MKKAGLIFLVCFIAMACSRNSLPSISRRTSEPSAPAPVVKKDFVIDAKKGEILFTNRCSRCHGIHDPKEFTAEKWDTILSRMIPRARLSNEEAANVTAYIKDGAK